MNFREMNLAVFEGRPIPHVFFQPRTESWYVWHKTFDKLPPRYRDVSLLDMYDDLRLSMRYVHYYTDQPDPIQRRFDRKVKITEQKTDTQMHIAYHTPHGDLVSRHVWTQDDTWREVDHPVKDRDDLIKLRWLCQHTYYDFSPDNYAQGCNFIGERGVGQFFMPKSPYQALAQIWMTLEGLVYALVDCRDEVEQTMAAIDESYDSLYEQLVGLSDTVQIVNFGENIHDQLLSPAYFERYLMPWWVKRSGQLRDAGMFTHVHIDGYFRTLLPYLKDLAFDGIEALTPKPQGDVPLEQIKEHIGDKVLLDGIPAILFIPPYTRDDLMQFTERVVDLFHPRLVLGASDEVPEGGGEEAIERVRLVSNYCRSRTA